MNAFKRFISAQLAGNIMLWAMGILAIFHILVLLGIVSPEIVWGGQFGSSPSNLVVLEIVALIVVALFALIIAAKLNYLDAGRLRRVATIGVWIIFLYFILNTIGNLASGVSVENLIFAPLTIVLAICALRLALEP